MANSIASSRYLPVIAVTLSLIGGVGVGALVARRVHALRAAALQPMVIVAGEPITRNQFNHQLDVGGGTEAIREMIESELALQFAAEHKLLPTNSAVEERIRSSKVISSPDQNLQQGKLTSEEIYQECRLQLIEEAINYSGEVVTDAEVAQYYQSQCDARSKSSKFYLPETAHTSIIVTLTIKEGLEAAAELRSGKPFAEVASAHSTDKSAVNGGNVPIIIHGRSTFAKLDPAFESAVFGLNPGEWTPPRKVGKSSFWIIVKCNSKQPARTIPFEEVRSECRRQVLKLKAEKKGPSPLAAEFKKFCQNASVKFYHPQ